MIVTKELALKGAAGLTTAAASTAAVVYRNEISSLFVGNNASRAITVAEINKKLTSLGLPVDCKFNESNISENEKDCGALDEAKLKAIKFDGKGTEEFSSVTSADQATLKIKKGADTSDFPEGIKITFVTSGNVNANGGTTLSIDWKNGTNPEYKIKNAGGNLTLEKAWTVTELAKKVGLTCSTVNNASECSFSGPIRVYESEGTKKATQATVGDTSKKLEFSEGQLNHNQGFKFTVKETADITLTPGTGDNSGITALTKNNTSYEIKFVEDGWYLSKKTNG